MPAPLLNVQQPRLTESYKLSAKSCRRPLRVALGRLKRKIPSPQLERRRPVFKAKTHDRE